MIFRFLLVPASSFALCALLGVEGLARNVLLVETAMPVVTQTVGFNATFSFASIQIAKELLAQYIKRNYNIIYL